MGRRDLERACSKYTYIITGYLSTHHSALHFICDVSKNIARGEVAIDAYIFRILQDFAWSIKTRT